MILNDRYYINAYKNGFMLLIIMKTLVLVVLIGLTLSV